MVYHFLRAFLTTVSVGGDRRVHDSYLRFDALIVANQHASSTRDVSMGERSFCVRLSASCPFVELSKFASARRRYVSLCFVHVGTASKVSMAGECRIGGVCRDVCLVRKGSARSSATRHFPQEAVATEIFPAFLVDLPDNVGHGRVLGKVHDMRFAVTCDRLICLFPREFTVDDILCHDASNCANGLQANFLCFFQCFCFRVCFCATFFR